MSKVSKSDRYSLNRHKPVVLWLTGLPASGKTTIAYEVDRILFSRGIRSYVLDGDNVRKGLCSDLGYTAAARRENIRRVAEVAKLFVDAGIFTIAAFISPYKSDRLAARTLFEEGEFVEVYLKCDLSVCERRDPKGLYKKARSGEIPNFSGVSDLYEPPDDPEIIVETGILSLEDSLKAVFSSLEDRGIL